MGRCTALRLAGDATWFVRVMPTASPPPEDSCVRLAAERGLLAWFRLGLALMGFGFADALFGLFVRELPTMSQTPRPPGWSPGLGVALIALGVLVNRLAAYEVSRTICRGQRRRLPATGRRT
jgi:putative membrane protein